MPTVSRGLPAQPHLDVPKKQARELLNDCKAQLSGALNRVKRQRSSWSEMSAETLAGSIKLSDAQFVIAREYGFASWAQLKQRINGNTAAQLIDKAIRSNDAATVTRLLADYPNLMHVPVISGNWGPPMSHAANLGRLEMVKTIAALGARDFQHAFDRALLHGDIEIAQWLHTQGAVLTPGIIMGCCETLNQHGFEFLVNAGAALANGEGNTLAPLAMVLETYSRNPAGKHAILQHFMRKGYNLPGTPVMAFHLGDVEGLKRHLQQDPQLINRRFTYREIYPLELGCGNNLTDGLHGTPIDGTTLLHLAIDFDEREIFDWLIGQGADVNAAASVDSDGFGGHTPLFNAIVSNAYANGLQKDGYMARQLLALGAHIYRRVNLRKYLDWREEPGWHIALNVTPHEWAANFPERGWVNKEAVGMIERL